MVLKKMKQTKMLDNALCTPIVMNTVENDTVPVWSLHVHICILCFVVFVQVCRNINNIKLCMEAGRTVILLNLENLYESLYDLLNQVS